MEVTKQPLNISFDRALDLKTDPFQIAIGSFLRLQNSVFDKDKRLTKRNGFALLTPLPNTTYSYLTTFSGNLIAIGTSLTAYSSGSSQWLTKATFQPLQLSTLPLIRSNTNQTQHDTAVAANGLVCTVYTDTLTSSTAYKYAISDSTTGQNIIVPTVIPVASGTVTGSPRVFLLGAYFIIVFTNVITAVSHIQYIAISTANPSTVVANTDIAAAYISATSLSWDGVVANNKLYIAYNTTTGGQAIKVTSLTSTLNVATAVTFAGQICTVMSLCADVTTASNPIIYAAYYDAAGATGYILAVDQNLNTVLSATQWLTTGVVTNVTCAAKSGTCTIIYELTNAYTYDSAIASNFLRYRTCTQAGALGTATILSRSVGLASKAFVYSSTIYFLAVYSSSYQPTYFLMNSSGSICAKLAYQNGGSYYITGLPSPSVSSSTVRVSYLFKDLIQAVNKNTNVASGTQVNGIYSQTGINMATVTFGTSGMTNSEIGSNLNLSGGIMWAYDGTVLTEQGFHLYPDSVEATTNTGVTPTGDTTNGSAVILNASSTASVGPGCTITGTGIPANTLVVSVSGTSITINKNATATNVGTTLTIKGNLIAQAYYYQATYEWADNQGNLFRSAPSIPITITSTTATSTNTVNIPTLRLTYKTANPVKIVLYRWSTAQQIYYQITSITAPTVNDPTVDYVTIVDALSDATILGNNIIYTNGGVLENTGAPACTAIALLKSRLFFIHAEDQNLLGFSKQVIEATPVELSDLLTLYVAPTISAQGPTGPMRVISALDDKLIIYKKNAIYYLTGIGPDNTGANNDFTEPTFITGTVGCTNQASVVLIPTGLMFQSDKGIWLLDRNLNTSYIGAPVEDYNSYTVLSALTIPGTNQVRFTLSNGVTLMYDYYFNRWGTFVGIPGVASTLYQNLHTFINSYGQALQESQGTYQDGPNPVLQGFTTGWINLAGLQGYQRAYFLYLLGTYLSPHKLQVGIAYDYAPGPSQVTLISPDNYNPNYGSYSGFYGSGTYGGTLALEHNRIILQKGKCMSFQVIVDEIYDSSIAAGAAGAGLTISGLDCVVGTKKGYSPIKASRTWG